jgi:hypothetical protein
MNVTFITMSRRFCGCNQLVGFRAGISSHKLILVGHRAQDKLKLGSVDDKSIDLDHKIRTLQYTNVIAVCLCSSSSDEWFEVDDE